MVPEGGGKKNTHEIARASPAQLAQLMRVPAVTDGEMEYRPCLVVLDDGSRLPRVYVVEAQAYKRNWCVWPWDDPAKVWIPIERVKQIQDSPERLPPKYATVLYHAGESGMGYVVFTVVLRDGRRLPYITGNAVDFPCWPPGVSPAMITDVIPHEGREHFRTPHVPTPPEKQSAEYVWCLYAT